MNIKTLGSIIIVDTGKEFISRIITNYNMKQNYGDMLMVLKVKTQDIRWQIENTGKGKINDIETKKLKNGIVFIMTLFEYKGEYIIKSIVGEKLAYFPFRLYGLLKWIYDRHTRNEVYVRKGTIFERNIIKRAK